MTTRRLIELVLVALVVLAVILLVVHPGSGLGCSVQVGR